MAHSRARLLFPLLPLALWALIAADGSAVLEGPSRSRADREQVSSDPPLATAGDAEIFRTPAGWSPAPGSGEGIPILALDADSRVRVLVHVETRLDHSDALRRLGQIGAEEPSEVGFLEIAGWPALRRRHLMPEARVGAEDDSESVTGKMVLLATTAVAAGDKVVRLEVELPPDAPEEILGQVESLDSGIAVAPPDGSVAVGEEILSLRQADPSSFVADGARSSRGAPSLDASAPPGLVSMARSAPGIDAESEIAVSGDGRSVVVAIGVRRFAFSADGGRRFTSGLIPVPFPSLGDPSIAWGPSGSFYYSYIGLPNGTPAAGGAQGCAASLSASVDRGRSFTFLSHAALCPLSGTTACFPDQIHIAADRKHPGPGGGDQIYAVWRNFRPSSGRASDCSLIAGGTVVPFLSCSMDGGTTWPFRLAIYNSGDFPRVSVGPDGRVYVVFRQGSNLVLSRFSSCAEGLAPSAGFPAVIARMSDVACPVPGLDRCNNGNLLSSHVVAPDDLRGNHLYAGYAASTQSGNEDILVRDSLDGGLTWPEERSVRINAPVAARRYMPWVCATRGVAFVSWFDRRRDPEVPEPTDYFGGSAFLDEHGNLSPGIDYRISPRPESPCDTGWACGARSRSDSESCATQPQLAGVCRDNSPSSHDSMIRCDFSDCDPGGQCPCPGNEFCGPFFGCPKYGDYVGNACAAGHVFTAWSSSAAIPSVHPSPTSIDVFFASFALRPFPAWTNVPLPLPGPAHAPDPAPAKRRD